jgi:hypothetical protein
MKNLNPKLASLVFIFGLCLNVQAQRKCNLIHQSTLATEAFLKSKNKVASGMVQTMGNKVPVVLVNTTSYPLLSEAFSRSIGVVVTHQPDYNNDHGLLRVGDQFMDRDTPGARNRGELNQTGISWASVKGYLDYTRGATESYKRIEVVFQLTETEFNVVNAYQKMRQAALIRPDFTFGGDNNPKNQMNHLPEGGEICFSFSTGSSVSSQISGIKRKISAYGLKNLEELSKSADFQNYLRSAVDLVGSSPFNSRSLNPQMLKNLETPNFVKELKLTAEKQTELTNWLVGLKLSQDYHEILSSLEIQNSSDFSNVRSRQASAVFIYDGATTAQDFAKPNYTSKGIFSTWTNNGFEALKRDN